MAEAEVMVFNDDNEESWCLSSDTDSAHTDPAGWSCFGDLPAVQEVPDVVAELKASESPDATVKAIASLQQFATCDLVVSPCWGDVVACLSSCLLGSDDELVVESAYQQVWRMFNCSSGATRETFAMLVDIISAHVRGGGLSQTVDRTFDAAALPNARLLRLVHLLRCFQLEISKYWTRYGQRNLEHVVDGAVLLLFSTTRSSDGAAARTLSLSHFSALLDPRAEWFETWMKGQNSRGCIFACLGKHPHLLAQCVHTTVSFVQAAKQRAVKARVDAAGSQSASTPGIYTVRLCASVRVFVWRA